MISSAFLAPLGWQGKPSMDDMAGQTLVKMVEAKLRVRETRNKGKKGK
jgi:hypothetical protein